MSTRKNHSPLKTPYMAAEWQRNARDRIRIQLSEYSGRDVVDIRTWWLAADGEYRPGRAGITVSINHLKRLTKGIKRAYARAIKLGLI